MLFNSVQFCLFLPICVALYFNTQERYKNTVLLFMSYVFYACWIPKYLLLIFFSTAVTWGCGFFVERMDNAVKRKVALAVTITINLAILFVFKYYDFFADIIIRIGIAENVQHISLLLPVGISFYTFQALGYAIDVYRGVVQHERNFIVYALFVSFFPQLVAGPIERSTSLLTQFKEKHYFDAERAAAGLRIILFGLFKKIVLADMLALYIDKMWPSYMSYGGATLFILSLMFTFQIYGDFSGYSDVARGTALLLGFRLMENFDMPYMAKSISEFWQRWHISLSTWFKDYLYIPLGGNRTSLTRKCFNLFIVFVVSGLWHGAALHFVAWGGIHGLFRVTEEIMYRRFSNFCIAVKEKNRKFTNTLLWLYTFLTANMAWIFFRASSTLEAIKFLQFMLSANGTHRKLLDMHIVSKIMPAFSCMRWTYVGVIVTALFLVIGSDIWRHQTGENFEAVLTTKPVVCRWATYYTLILLVIFSFVMTTNKYGQAGAFLYFQF